MEVPSGCVSEFYASSKPSKIRLTFFLTFFFSFHISFHSNSTFQLSIKIFIFIYKTSLCQIILFFKILSKEINSALLSHTCKLYEGWASQCFYFNVNKYFLLLLTIMVLKILLLWYVLLGNLTTLCIKGVNGRLSYLFVWFFILFVFIWSFLTIFIFFFFFSYCNNAIGRVWFQFFINLK